MKKKRWILLLIVFVLGSLFIFPSFPVNADSGWDSDYGGGGSSSSGGGSSSSGGGYDIDFDSGSSYDVNHSREYYIVCFIIMLIILTSAFYCLCRYNEKYRTKYMRVKSIIRGKFGYYDKLIAKLIPGYNVQLLLNELYSIFVDIQKSRMEFDYDKLEKLCVDELYQSYKADLEVLKLKNEKIILDHYRLEEAYINSIKKVENQIVINISLSTSFVDCVINTDTEKIIRGNRNELIYKKYSLTYVIGIDKTQVAICPSCGAEVKGKKCPYCHSVVKEAHHHFMLSKKTKS